MDDLPAPPVPADCDLRSFGYMPLDITRLFGSRFHAVANDAEWRAGVTLWAKSFHQVPAASIPDDDVELCRLAELGRDLKAWLKLREVALHGWIKCSDGRLYHPVVAQKAKEAWEAKQARRARTEAARAKRHGHTVTEAPRPSVTASVTENATDLVTGSNLTEQNLTEPSLGSQRTSPATDGKPDGWLGQWEGTRASGTNPRATGANPRAQAAERATRLPPDWQPSEAAAAYARNLGLDPAKVAERFRNYWHAKAGKDAAKLDWDATWRNWCMTEAERNPPARKPTPSGYVPSPVSGAL